MCNYSEPCTCPGRGWGWVEGSARGLSLWQDRRLAGVPRFLARSLQKKFLRFLISQELFSMHGFPRPISTLFTAQSGLTRELLSTKFHIDPRTSLLTLPGPVALRHPVLVPATTSLLRKIFLDQSFHINHIQWILLRLIS